jgi:hypothetical protein
MACIQTSSAYFRACFAKSLAQGRRMGHPADKSGVIARWRGVMESGLISGWLEAARLENEQ